MNRVCLQQFLSPCTNILVKLVFLTKCWTSLHLCLNNPAFQGWFGWFFPHVQLWKLLPAVKPAKQQVFLGCSMLYFYLYWSLKYSGMNESTLLPLRHLTLNKKHAHPVLSVLRVSQLLFGNLHHIKSMLVSHGQQGTCSYSKNTRGAEWQHVEQVHAEPTVSSSEGDSHNRYHCVDQVFRHSPESLCQSCLVCDSGCRKTATWLFEESEDCAAESPGVGNHGCQMRNILLWRTNILVRK